MSTDVTFVSNVDLSTNEIRNARAHVLATAPTGIEGRFYYDSALKKLMYYNGTAWVAASEVALANLSGQASAFGQAASNGTAGTAARSDHYHALPAHNAAAHSAIKLSDLAAPSASVSMGGNKITGLAAGTAAGEAVRFEQLAGYQPFDGDLTALAGLAANGYARRTGTDTWTVDAAIPQASVTNLTTDLAAKAPSNSPTFTGTVSLPAATSIGSITSTELGYIDGLTSSAQTQLDAKVAGAGTVVDNRVARFDGTTGKAIQQSTVSISDTGVISGLADGVGATDAATVGQIQAASQGLSVKQSVRAASAFTGPNPPSGVGAGMSLGITPVNGDRILVKDQSTGSQNGIYIVNTAGPWTRATDFDTTAKIGKNAFVFVEEGTFADTGWVLTNDTPITVGTTTMVWRQFSGAGAFTAGNGLTQSGTTFHVGTAIGGGLIANADDLAIDFYTGWQQTGVTQRVARKVSKAIGGMGPTFTVDHFLGTRDVTVTIRQTDAPYAVVHAGVEITSDTQITVTTAYALNPDELTVVVVG